MASILKAGLSPAPAPRPAPATLPPIRYAAAAAAAVSSAATPSSALPTTPSSTLLHPTTTSTAPSIPQPPSHPPAPSESQPISISSPSLTQLSVASPMLSSAASASQQADGVFYSGQESPVESDAKAPQSPQRETSSRKGRIIGIDVNSANLNRCSTISISPRTFLCTSGMLRKTYLIFMANFSISSTLCKFLKGRPTALKASQVLWLDLCLHPCLNNFSNTLRNLHP